MNYASGSRAALLASRVRRYFEGCNEGDAAKMLSTFAPQVIHYFPPAMFGPVVGGDAITELWRTFVQTHGSQWTIDNLVADENQVVVEWTHFQPKTESYIRGAEWYQFDEQGYITEIKAYYASPRDMSRPANELAGYPYAERGYPTVALSVANRRERCE